VSAQGLGRTGLSQSYGPGDDAATVGNDDRRLVIEHRRDRRSDSQPSDRARRDPRDYGGITDLPAAPVLDSRQLSWITAVRHDRSVIRASRPADIASTAASRPSAHFRDGAAAAWPGTRGAAEAVAAYETAITLTRNDAERAFLAERLRKLG